MTRPDPAVARILARTHGDSIADALEAPAAECFDVVVAKALEAIGDLAIEEDADRLPLGGRPGRRHQRALDRCAAICGVLADWPGAPFGMTALNVQLVLAAARIEATAGRS